MMTLLFWTTITTAIAVVALIYIIRLFNKRKNYLDFPNHLFVAGAVLLISASLTIIQLYDLSKETAIHFEEEDQYLSASRWISIEQYGEYGTCKATYYPITKDIIDLQYENYLGPEEE